MNLRDVMDHAGNRATAHRAISREIRDPWNMGFHTGAAAAFAYVLDQLRQVELPASPAKPAPSYPLHCDTCGGPLVVRWAWGRWDFAHDVVAGPDWHCPDGRTVAEWGGSPKVPWGMLTLEQQAATTREDQR